MKPKFTPLSERRQSPAQRGKLDNCKEDVVFSWQIVYVVAPHRNISLSLIREEREGQALAKYFLKTSGELVAYTTYEPHTLKQ